MGLFNGLGAGATEAAVAKGSALEHFDVIEDVGFCHVARSVDSYIDTFLFPAAG
jgi:hypothetical protein